MKFDMQKSREIDMRIRPFVNNPSDLYLTKTEVANDYSTVIFVDTFGDGTRLSYHMNGDDKNRCDLIQISGPSREYIARYLLTTLIETHLSIPAITLETKSAKFNLSESTVLIVDWFYS